MFIGPFRSMTSELWTSWIYMQNHIGISTSMYISLGKKSVFSPDSQSGLWPRKGLGSMAFKFSKCFHLNYNGLIAAAYPTFYFQLVSSDI